MKLATLGEEKDKLWIIDGRILEPLHSTKSAKCDVNIGWIVSLLFFFLNLHQQISLQTILIKDILAL
jgi:hypothetical protein